MAKRRLRDPTLGELRFDEALNGVTYFRGEADLTPKHRVVLDFALPDGADAEAGLAEARTTYLRLQQKEWEYRLASAAEYFDASGQALARRARSLKLERIDLHATSGEVRLIYVCHTDSGEEDLAVTFDEGGSLLDLEDPYR